MFRTAHNRRPLLPAGPLTVLALGSVGVIVWTLLAQPSRGYRAGSRDGAQREEDNGVKGTRTKQHPWTPRHTPFQILHHYHPPRSKKRANPVLGGHAVEILEAAKDHSRFRVSERRRESEGNIERRGEREKEKAEEHEEVKRAPRRLPAMTAGKSIRETQVGDRPQYFVLLCTLTKHQTRPSVFADSTDESLADNSNTFNRGYRVSIGMPWRSVVRVRGDGRQGPIAQSGLMSAILLVSDQNPAGSAKKLSARVVRSVHGMIAKKILSAVPKKNSPDDRAVYTRPLLGFTSMSKSSFALVRRYSGAVHPSDYLPLCATGVLEVLSAEANADRWSIEKRQLTERVISLRRAAGQRLPSNHLDATTKILLRQQDSGRIQLQNKGGLVVIDFTETGARFLKQWVKPARGAQPVPKPTKREKQALMHYRAHAELLMPVRDALTGPACMDHRLWDAEMVPVVIREHMDTIDRISEGITQLQDNLEHVHTRLESAERRLANLGYRIDEDGNIVVMNNAP
ncbi:hypothetical protein LXA43DRAFT_1068621 [Ganoderma leucocontextum]|nr:hypothetical protein LXA43DRAFT_1068621 [Ganoderma leucocontextum]